MSRIKQTFASVKERFNKNFTFKGVALLLIGFANWLPDAFGRADFWSKNIGWAWRIIYSHSTFSVTVLCGLLIWIDHRRVIAQRAPKAPDAKTVKGRTLQLRDNLQMLLNEATAKWPEHMGERLAAGDNSALENSYNRGGFILHTFALKFEEQAVKVYHECALAGTDNSRFGSRLDQPIASASQLRVLINDLDWMAEHVD